MIEDARARVLDGDTTRRGFGDLHQGLFAVSIDVAMRRGQAVAALELAEQARARALLDLMQHGRTARRQPGAASNRRDAGHRPRVGHDRARLLGRSGVDVRVGRVRGRGARASPDRRGASAAAVGASGGRLG